MLPSSMMLQLSNQDLINAEGMQMDYNTLFLSRLHFIITFRISLFQMSDRCTKFREEYLKENDNNDVLISKWCRKHATDSCKAYCFVCRKDISLANNGIKALSLTVGRRATNVE
jgi:hypothetical protein